jgi:hypothetical protein
MSDNEGKLTALKSSMRKISKNYATPNQKTNFLITENKSVEFGPTTETFTGEELSTDYIINRRKKIGRRGPRVFTGLASTIVDNLEEEGHIQKRDLFLTPRDKDKLTENLNWWFQNWRDPNSVQNLQKSANTDNPNQGQYSKEGRVNIVRIVNGNPVGKEITPDDIKATNDYVYRVRICEIAKTCVTYAISGAFLAKKFGLWGGRTTRRNKRSKRTKRSKKTKRRKPSR